jgi:chemosensory pili system protein ChpA (sensor histidine kinase/response regulator)
VDQFTLVCDSLVKLHPGSLPQARALMQVVHSVATQAQSPSPEVAMEVATAVLYLQAAFASLDMADDAMASHADTLAGRLLQVLAGQPAQPLEPWMEQLYRQVSDQQTMGSVVGELRGTLADAEKLLDQYFRNPADTAVLAPVVAREGGGLVGGLVGAEGGEPGVDEGDGIVAPSAISAFDGRHWWRKVT